ncbi:NADH-quinone oxidoreductase subunit G, partial [Erwinia amylovora]|nr:NADH-quinone oxidoreductase subunit G [Erwinia amylovora]
ALAGAKKPLIISGTHAGIEAMIQAAANVARALKGRGADVGITLLAAATNSVGLGLIGGQSLDTALAELTSGAADAAIVLENDLYRHLPQATVDAALSTTH